MCKIRILTLAYGRHCWLLTHSHPIVSSLPSSMLHMHACSLSFTYTLIFYRSLSLTLEAPSIRSLLSQLSFSPIRVIRPSSGVLNWRKCHNIFWERFFSPPSPGPKYIHGQKYWSSLLGVVILRCAVCNCLSHMTMREGTLTHRVQQNKKMDSLNLWWYHHPGKLLLYE